MKRIVALFFLLPFLCQSQDRVNRQFAKLSAPLASITSATGWRLDDNQRWISRPNKIPITFGNNKLIDYEEDGLGVNNFTSLQIRKVYYGGDSTLLLIKKFKDGWYKYPAIHEDWIQDYNCYYATISPAEWNEKLNYVDDSTGFLRINTHIRFTGYLLGKSELDIIKKDYDTASYAIPGLKDYLIIEYRMYPQKGIARFVLYSYQYGDALLKRMYYDQQEEMDNLFDDQNVMDKAYYELPISVFKNFLKQYH